MLAKPLPGGVTVRLTGMETANDCGLFVIGEMRLDARERADGGLRTVGGDDQPRVNHLPVLQTQARITPRLERQAGHCPVDDLDRREPQGLFEDPRQFTTLDDRGKRLERGLVGIELEYRRCGARRGQNTHALHGIGALRVERRPYAQRAQQRCRRTGQGEDAGVPPRSGLGTLDGSRADQRDRSPEARQGKRRGEADGAPPDDNDVRRERAGGCGEHRSIIGLGRARL